jgi:hypothetical protein
MIPPNGVNESVKSDIERYTNTVRKIRQCVFKIIDSLLAIFYHIGLIVYIVLMLVSDDIIMRLNSVQSVQKSTVDTGMQTEPQEGSYYPVYIHTTSYAPESSEIESDSSDESSSGESGQFSN